LVGTGVLVGGTSVLVGTGVLVAGTGVCVGGATVLVGDIGALVGVPVAAGVVVTAAVPVAAGVAVTVGVVVIVTTSTSGARVPVTETVGVIVAVGDGVTVGTPLVTVDAAQSSASLFWASRPTTQTLLLHWPGCESVPDTVRVVDAPTSRPLLRFQLTKPVCGSMLPPALELP